MSNGRAPKKNRELPPMTAEDQAIMDAGPDVSNDAALAELDAARNAPAEVDEIIVDGLQQEESPSAEQASEDSDGGDGEHAGAAVSVPVGLPRKKGRKIGEFPALFRSMHASGMLSPDQVDYLYDIKPGATLAVLHMMDGIRVIDSSSQIPLANFYPDFLNIVQDCSRAAGAQHKRAPFQRVRLELIEPGREPWNMMVTLPEGFFDEEEPVEPDLAAQDEEVHTAARPNAPDPIAPPLTSQPAFTPPLQPASPPNAYPADRDMVRMLLDQINQTNAEARRERDELMRQMSAMTDKLVLQAQQAANRPESEESRELKDLVKEYRTETLKQVMATARGENPRAASALKQAINTVKDVLDMKKEITEIEVASAPAPAKDAAPGMFAEFIPVIKEGAQAWIKDKFTPKSAPVAGQPDTPLLNGPGAVDPGEEERGAAFG